MHCPKSIADLFLSPGNLRQCGLPLPKFSGQNSGSGSPHCLKLPRTRNPVSNLKDLDRLPSDRMAGWLQSFSSKSGAWSQLAPRRQPRISGGSARRGPGFTWPASSCIQRQAPFVGYNATLVPSDQYPLGRGSLAKSLARKE